MIASQRIISPHKKSTAPITSLAFIASQHTSSNVIVRHAESNDSEALHQLFTEPQIVYWTIELPFAPIGQTHKRLAHDAEEQYTLVACEGRNVLGSLSLAINTSPRLRHVGHIGPVAVQPHCQGQGVGSKLMKAALDLADNWLNIHRLELLVYADNEHAIALYKKHGFISEGIMRHAAFRSGQYVDTQIMGRINQHKP